jgi:small-conductance mechanosensitive channel
VFDWYFSKHREANVPSVLRFVAIGAIYAVFGMVFLQVIFGLNILPLLATSTILTAVLGLALQDTLKNLFAGITLSFEKRFRQGDWIQFRLDANNVSVGQVLEIGWRTTKMRTLENTFSVIPNSMFATNHMINFTHSGATFMRYVELAVQVRADLNSLMPILAQAAERVEGVLSEPAPDVILFGVKPDHLLLRVRFSIGDFSQADVINSRVACETLKELEALQLVPALISAAPPPPPALPLSSSPAV